MRIAENQPLSLTEAAQALLSLQVFKGNIRELKNILERAVVLRNDDQIDVDVIQQSLHLLPVKNVALHDDLEATPESAFQLLADNKLSLEQLEQTYLHTLLQTYPDKGLVADIAGCSLRTLYRKLEQ